MNTEAAAEATNQISTLALFWIGAAGGIGALGAGLVSAMVLFFNQRRSERHALANWYRDNKSTAYADYVHAVVKLGVLKRAKAANKNDANEEMSRTELRVQILMDPATFHAVQLLATRTASEKITSSEAAHAKNALVLLLQNDISATLTSPAKRKRIIEDHFKEERSPREKRR